MKYSYFTEILDDIYATFGKNLPNSQKVRDAIFRRVEHMPEAFMDFARQRLADEEKLPANLGRYLARELWPDFLDLNPHLRQRESGGCWECDTKTPGYIQCWTPDGSRMQCECVCRKGDKGWTRQKILDAGWLLSDPLEAENESRPRYIPPRLRKAIGHVEEPRPAHVECLEEMEVF